MTAGFSGGDALTITIDDQGYTGLGGALSDADTVAISVATAPPVTRLLGIRSSAQADEGEALVYTVTMSPTSAGPVTVEYGTRELDASQYGAAIRATAGADYVPGGGTLTFLPGEWEKSFSISTVEDALVEENEGFEVYIANASGAELGARSTIANIIDDDVAPFV